MPEIIRKSTPYLALTTTAVILLSGLIWLHPLLTKQYTNARLEHERQIVNALQLTDLALFTEATYTRHPNLADRFVPFQNHPMALSQFPAESLLPPPVHLLSTWAAKVWQETQ